ncbi:phage tail sheath family protein [Cyclobacterium jeungdonense]|uniref:Phage tail sheath subtilisin-like domain-containing protein n=1 Tax=Cyclobacterium jeungdonense TaxID=708087 RepID=A0ABT8CAI4_9BACT|nr:phage tail sheath C-terminal domain-containing protein [Cyclobacterium jeungdonense]MDN3689785.1 phage tail sheath subtilisin-like domain-containing protein [Cyclobacterium jeungdonense]
MGTIKKPGVHIEEKNAFPSSVIQVSSAVPAFIGYTAKRPTNQARRITSFSEFNQYFGGPAPYLFRLHGKGDDTNLPEQAPSAKETVANEAIGEINGYSLSRVGSAYRLYNAMLLFYQNGGGTCYIVSVGGYDDGEPIQAASLMAGLQALEQEPEPSLVLVPDAVSLDTAEAFYSLCRKVIAHCGQMRSRMAILDVYQGYNALQNPAGGKSVVDRFREKVGSESLSYAAAYYPWLETTIVNESDLSFQNLTDDSLELMVEMIRNELSLDDQPETEPKWEAKRKKMLAALVKQLLDYAAAAVKDGTDHPGDTEKPSPADMHRSLLTVSPAYKDLLEYLRKSLNQLPPAAAMAGLYSLVDSTSGVWKAPANLSIISVIAPSVPISTEEQEYLNAPLDGKAVNAIRSFIGKGVLVWGARTLDGNSNEWRYIHVRRTVMVLEQSMLLAVKAYTFEPNQNATWTTVKSMLINYLTQQWKMGALAGASPAEAFSVRVGLGETMTAEDIQSGIMRVTALVAVNRPAEFIEISFAQPMQKI